MELIEHWWNTKADGLDGHDGLGRQDVFVRRNPAGQYEVEHRTSGRSALREYPSREQALIIAEALRVDPADWRDLTGAYQR